MNRAALSYQQMENYLLLLTENDLLYYDKETGTFKATGKGVMFLDIYNELDEMLKEDHY